MTTIRNLVCLAIVVTCASSVFAQTRPKQATPVTPLKYVLATVSWKWDSDCTASESFWVPVKYEQKEFFAKVIASNIAEHEQVPSNIEAYLKLLRSDKVMNERKLLKTRDICSNTSSCVYCNKQQLELANQYRDQIQMRVDEIIARRDALYSQEGLLSVEEVLKLKAESSRLRAESELSKFLANRRKVEVTRSKTKVSEYNSEYRSETTSYSSEESDPDLMSLARREAQEADEIDKQIEDRASQAHRIGAFAIDQETQKIYTYLKWSFLNP